MSEIPKLDYQSPANPAEAPKGALRIIFLIVLLDLMGFGVIIPLLPFYALNYKASPLQVGILFSIYSICQLIASPFLGLLSDKYGRRPVLILSLLGSVIGYVLLGLVTQYEFHSAALALMLIYLSRVIDGLSGGNISTAQAYISDVTTEVNRAKGMGLLGAAFGLGFALGPALGGLLGGAPHHAHLPAYAAALFSGLAMLLTWLKLPESRIHRPSDAQFFMHPSRFLPILRNPMLFHLLLIAFFSMAAFVMLEATIAMFLQKTFNYGGREVGFFFLFLGIIIILVQGGLIGKLTKRYGEWPLAVIGIVLVAAGMANYWTLGLHPLLWILLINGFLNAVGRSLQTPSISSLVSKYASRDEQGAAFGLFHAVSSFARVVGPLAGTTLYTWHIAGPFVAGGLVSAMVAIWTLLLQRKAMSETAQAYKPGFGVN